MKNPNYHKIFLIILLVGWLTDLISSIIGVGFMGFIEVHKLPALLMKDGIIGWSRWAMLNLLVLIGISSIAFFAYQRSNGWFCKSIVWGVIIFTSLIYFVQGILNFILIFKVI